MGVITNLKGRLDMSKLALIAAMMVSMGLSMGIVLYPQGSANAAVRYCVKVKGAEHPDCSFRQLNVCRAHAREMGGGHCYPLHH
jgi:hypothetical protein